jgi:putative restriction endonuclease
MRYGDVLPRKLIEQGFVLDDTRVPFVGPSGIFKPKILREAPISITTTPSGPYQDRIGPDGLLHYSYRGEDQNHRDNRGLRTAMRERLPLIYFHGISTGRYVATWPAFVVGDAPSLLTFSVEFDDSWHLGIDTKSGENGSSVGVDTAEGRRAYITSTVRVRLHQRAFRERVLEAYRRQCAFCRLRHEELLDAAHIIPDSQPAGEPIVPNGVALCNLHHAAFDKFFVGLRPDYVIEVRADILKEGDGPTLKHAIQGLHGARMQLPHRMELRPDIDLLSQRYAHFLEAAR